LKAILMEMFGISQKLYNNASHSILNRHKDKSVFVQKLSDTVNGLPASKKAKSEKKATLKE